MSPRRPFTRGRRAAMGWGGTVAVGFTLVPPASKVLLTTALPIWPGGETLRRLRGTFTVISDQAVVFETQNGAVGACVVGDTAVAAGIASIKDPVTDVEDDTWLWYHSFNLFNDAGRSASGGMNLFTIDSKAQRKLPIGNTLVFVAANASALFGYSISLSVRALGSETAS